MLQRVVCRLTPPNRQVLPVRGNAQCSSGNNIVSKNEAIRFYECCLVEVGAKKSNARQMAEVLQAADYRGRFSHGINRIEMYVKDVRCRTTDGCAVPCIIKETPNTAWVNGNNALGAVVGNYCMDLAIKKAIAGSVSWVVANSSNHYGISSWYTMKAVEDGLVGIVLTNTSPMVVPFGAVCGAMGANPIAMGAPARFCDYFSLDMATCCASMGKIEVAMEKKKKIPLGWALDSCGKPTTDAAEAFKARRLVPLGGTLAGHKGYALGIMVELLTGILGDASYGEHIRQWMTYDKPACLGQTFACLNPECFAPGFQQRLRCFMEYLRNMEPACPSKPVQVPGDWERENMKKANKLGGVAYEEYALKKMRKLAKELDIVPMKTKPARKC